MSYPAASYGGYIKELKTLPLFSIYTLFIVALLVFIYKTYKKSTNLDILLALLGVVLLGLHLRNFYIFGVFSLPYILSVQNNSARQDRKSVMPFVLPALTVLISITAFYFIIYISFSNYLK